MKKSVITAIIMSSVFMSALCSCGEAKNNNPSSASESSAVTTTVEETTAAEETTETTAAETTAETSFTESEAAGENKEDTAADTASVAGVYSSKDGVVVLNQDRTGSISIQDTELITWTDNELLGAGSAYPYTVDGDTLTVEIAGIKSSFSKNGETPQPDPDLMSNSLIGTYKAVTGETLVLNDDWTGTLTIQDTVDINWRGDKIGNEDFSYEYRVSGNILTLYYNDTEIIFEKQ